MKSLLFLLFIPFSAYCQFPTQSIIREKGITKMEVWRHNLPPITSAIFAEDNTTATLDDDDEADTIITLEKTWFFDALGRPIRSEFKVEGEEYVGEFAYDEEGRISQRIFSSNGVITFSEEVNQKPDSLFEFKRWKDRKLVDHYVTYPDSTIHYSFPIEQGHLPYYKFNRDSNYLQIAEYRKGRLQSLHREQMIFGVDGQPSAIEVDFRQFRRATKRNGRKKSFHSIIPLGVDRIHSTDKSTCSYFLGGGRMSKLIQEEEIYKFNQDSLLERTDDIIILSFDKDEEHYFHSFNFYYATDQY